MENTAWRVLVCAISLLLLTTAADAASVNDAHGKEWRQLTETTGLSWNQVAQVCPSDGVSPCSGSVGGRDLTGWVWATDVQVIALFSYYEPAILTSPSVSGMPYFFTASTFLSSFQPTFSFTITYASAQNAAGWTASTDTNNFPIAGFVGAGTTPVTINGQFTVGPLSDANLSDPARGVFLWRDTGLAGGSPMAYDDSGSVPSPAGGVAVANVLANDWIAGARATPDNVVVLQGSSSHPGVTLDRADGSVDVASGTSAGVYFLVYQICVVGNPNNCDSAAVRVTVNPYVIDAVNDAGAASPSTGGTAVANVLANDRLGSLTATTANVTLNSLSSTNSGISLDLSDGSVDVAAGTPQATHSLAYKICEAANPVNCDQATVTVTVQPYAIDAVNDTAAGSSKRANTALTSVLANDWFAAVRATTQKVKLTQVSLTPASNDIRLDVADGSVDVLRKTDSGTYKLVYSICEIASPSNCDQATVTIDLSGRN